MSMFIGIDPPKGFAVWMSVPGAFREIITADFWGIVDKLQEYKGQNPTVIIEAPQFNRPTFYRPGQNARAMSRISQNVGANKETSKLLIEYCEREGIAVRPVPPRGRNATKHDAAMFARLSGWTKVTSEHGRDAAMFVLGMK